MPDSPAPPDPRRRVPMKKMAMAPPVDASSDMPFPTDMDVDGADPVNGLMDALDTHTEKVEVDKDFFNGMRICALEHGGQLLPLWRICCTWLSSTVDALRVRC